ncbi:MAG: hypothetical protein ABF912_13100, partial [Lacticaseibacillus paracasei]
LLDRQKLAADSEGRMELMLQTVLYVLLTPSAPIWRYLLLVVAGVIIGTTIAKGWRQWIE